MATLDIFQSDLRPMQYWHVRAQEKADLWKQGIAEGQSTGFRSLDAYSRLVGGELTLIAARPSQGKCLGKGTKVVMVDGTLKTVEDVRVGDQLMGPDSTPRNVLSLARGREMMYWVRQKRGIDYRVNESHILSLKRSKNEGPHAHGDVLNISIRNVLDKGPGFFSRWKGYKVAIDLPEREVPLDPYFVGLWLGDGKTTSAIVYSTDNEVITYLREYAQERGEFVSEKDTNRPCPGYLVTGGRSQAARDVSIQAELRNLNLLGNKHIPECYLLNSTHNRLQLLAGLLDSDGYYAGHYNNGRKAGNYYEITSKGEQLARQVKFLADTLGFRTSIKDKQARAQTGESKTVYRVRIAGDVSRIPCKLERKIALPWADFRDWQHTGISIEPDRVDNYYGFALDGDHLFLLEDMTVTHNTAIAMQVAENMARQLQEDGDHGCVAVFSAEMSGWSLYHRMAGAMAAVNTHKLRSGKGTPEEYARFDEAMNRLRTVPIWIDDNTGPTTAQMLDQLSRLNETIPVRMMMFDFVELGGDRAQKEDLRISAIAHNLKGIAKTMQIPVLALSQLNRDVENRANKMPALADLRYSGMLEQLADVVMFIMRPEYYVERAQQVDVPPEDKQGVAYVQYAKNRNGPVGLAKLAYIKDRVMFGELAKDPLGRPVK